MKKIEVSKHMSVSKWWHWQCNILGDLSL